MGKQTQRTVRKGMEIREYLEEIRIFKQMPLEEIAAKTGIAPRKLFCLFHEEKPWPRALAEQIADAMGLPAAETPAERIAAFYKREAFTKLGEDGGALLSGYRRLSAQKQAFLRMTLAMLENMDSLADCAFLPPSAKQGASDRAPPCGEKAPAAK